MTAACHKEILIGLNEDSVRARRIRMKSNTPLKTSSRLHVITNASVEKTIADKKYEDYHGSTRNDMLSLVVLPPYELAWNLPLKEKIAVYAHIEGTRRVSTSTEAYLLGFTVKEHVVQYNTLTIMLNNSSIVNTMLFHRLFQIGPITSQSRFSLEAFLQTCGKTFSRPLARKVSSIYLLEKAKCAKPQFPCGSHAWHFVSATCM